MLLCPTEERLLWLEGKREWVVNGDSGLYSGEVEEKVLVVWTITVTKLSWE